MKERDLAEQLMRDHVLAARALAALQLNQLSEGIRIRVNQAIASGTGFAELRTRISTGETELILVPDDGSAPLVLAQTMGQVSNRDRLASVWKERRIDECPA